MAMEFVRLAVAGPWLGKTRLEASRGKEALTPVGRSVVKHTLPISPSRPRFALEQLCQVGPVLAMRAQPNKATGTGKNS